LQKDDGDKSLPRPGFYTTHHVTLENLKSGKTYTFAIYQGIGKKYIGRLTTAQALSSLPSPNPVYGRVLDKNKKPIVGAMVYLRAKNGSKSSTLLSALTNLSGRWSLDLGNLRTEDFKSAFPTSASTVEEILIYAGTKGTGKATTSPGKDKPWPDLIVTNEK